MKKTLIIHPDDRSTDFLAPIYANIFQATGWDPRPQSFNEGDAWMGAKLEFNGSDNFANNFTNNFANEANANNNFLVLFLIILLVVLVSMVLIMVAKKRKPKIEFGGRCVMGSNDSK